MEKKNILFVGEHPHSFTGNAGMMNAILAQVDREKYNVVCFGANSVSNNNQIFTDTKFTYIDAEEKGDHWGRQKLLSTLASNDVDVMVMVGLDIWRYVDIFDHIDKIRAEKGFKWVSIFPYDLIDFREDWAEWIRLIDYPCVYSQYGYDILSSHIPKVQYFRPPINKVEMYKSYTKEERIQARHEIFPSVRDDQFIFGFIGPNQYRKDPQGMLDAFKILKEKVPNAVLYMHTELKGIFNLKRYMNDLGLKTGDVVVKPTQFVSDIQMVKTYNAIDCFVNCSLQEGLSYTVLNAMLCGTPVIASASTAHIELLQDSVGWLVPTVQDTYIPIISDSGETWARAKKCTAEQIAFAMHEMVVNDQNRELHAQSGLEKVDQWLDGVSNINDVLENIRYEIIETTKKDEILFVQHSSAGDILMTTRCLKPIKEKHPGKKLVYMTQKKYQDIIEGNPNVDEIIDWDEDKIREYAIVYNPHGEKILPGGWNNGDVKLADMYPYFCKVKPDEFFIQEKQPDTAILPEKYIVVHTTGGQAEYRTYQHMDIALRGLDLPIVQIGGASDYVCHKATFDFRGKLTFQETAWVMKRAAAAICVDSFPMHLAAALGTPVIGLFGPAPARVTGPVGNPDKIINLEPDRLAVCPIVCNCWGQLGKTKCQSPCINTINPGLVRAAVLKLLGQGV